MKRIYYITMMLVLFFIQSNAQNSNRLYIPNVNISRGEEAVIQVSMSNVDTITAVEFTLSLPAGLRVNPVSAALADRVTNHTITARTLNDGRCKFMVFSPDNSPINGSDGLLFSVHVTADNNAEDNHEYPMTVTDAVMAISTGENVLQSLETGYIHVGNLPNLHIVSLDCSDPVAGHKMTVQWKVRNDGTVETGDKQWKDYIWLVPNISGGSTMFGSQLLATVGNLSALAPGQSYTNTFDVQLAERIYGNYDLLVTSDMYGARNIDFSQAGGAPPIPYAPETSDYGYLMAYAEPRYDLVMEEGEYNGWSDNFFYKRINIVVPPLADLQVNHVVAEVDNSSSYSGETDGPSPLSNAGLASSTLFYSGKKVKVTAFIKNGGGGNVRPSTITNQLYISTSPDLSEGEKKLLDTHQMSSGLNSGEETQDVLSGTIPYEWTGETYFVVVVDVADVVYESANTGNNMGATSTIDVILTPGADFKPYNLIVPAEVSSTTPIDIAYSVENIGPGVPYVNRWRDKVYVSSKDTGIDASAIEVLSSEQYGRYNKVGSEYVYEGDNYTKSFTIDGSKIKNLNSSGLYVYVKVDADNSVLEYDGEDNNVIMSQRIPIVKTDITSELVSISQDTLASGNTVAFSWVVKNNSTVGLTNTSVKDRLFIQSDNLSQPIVLAEVTNTMSIAPGEEKLLHANVKIPTHEPISGDMNVYVSTNVDEKIAETDFSNNTSLPLSRFVKLVNNPTGDNIKEKGINLTVFNIQTVQEVSPGQQISLSYNIKNTGELNIESNVMQEVFISKNSSFSLASSKLCDVLTPVPDVAGLEPGQSVTVNLDVALPEDMEGGQNYIQVMINRDRTLQETRSDDNQVITPVFINGNMPDLTISDIQVPQIVMTSDPTPISWTVKNVGDWNAKATTCRVYLSNNEYFDNSDVKLANVSVNELARSESVNLTTEIELNDNVVGAKYIIIRADVDRQLTESNLDNNTGIAAFRARQSPLPDLVASGLTSDDEWQSGETVTIKATVTNSGDRETSKDKWADVFYLSDGYTLNPNKAIKLGSKAHVGRLGKGESYEINAEFNVPINYSGYYVLFVVTDGNQAIIEKDEDNNSVNKAICIKNKSESPADLIVKNVSAPAKINAGEMIAMSYTIANVGVYQASGVVRDLLYMSKDETWDESDYMIGAAYEELTINPGEEKTRWVAGRIASVPEGYYHLIVRTNTTHNVAETDYSNNMTAQSNLCSVEFPRLVLGESVTANGFGLYKMPLTSDVEGKTIGIFMTYTDDAFAGLFSSYEQVPTSATYQYSSHNLEEDHQEILMSDVQEGTYYVMAQGNTTAATTLPSAGNFGINYYFEVIADASSIPSDMQGTAMTITAREVPFGATTLSVNEGGVDGWISTNVRGALFDSIMDFRLEKGVTVLPAESITFHDQTSSYATFDLHDMETGYYDFISELPTGAHAVLPDGFRVVPAANVNLGVKLSAPKVTRIEGYAPVSVSYVNSGNNDIVIRELWLTIRGGQLGESIEEIKNAPKQELHIRPDVNLDNRGYLVIPPGREQTFNYYFKQTAGNTYLQLYIVK